jgi:hypothetical protein
VVDSWKNDNKINGYNYWNYAGIILATSVATDRKFCGKVREGSMPTERGTYTFRVKEGTRGPFIAAEPYDPLPSIKGLLYFDLRDGLTLEQAQEIANIMNVNIRSLVVDNDVK